jgi:hypothetical protein
MMSTRLQANATAGETISCVAGQVAARHDIARIDKHTLEAWRAEATERSLYLVGRPHAGRIRDWPPARRVAGAGRTARAGNRHMATRGARVVLVDDNGVRATMTASWLKQMDWRDVAVLVAGPGDEDWTSGRHVPRVLGLEDLAVMGLSATNLGDRSAAGTVVVIDLDLSRRHARRPIFPVRGSRSALGC